MWWLLSHVLDHQSSAISCSCWLHSFTSVVWSLVSMVTVPDRLDWPWTVTFQNTINWSCLSGLVFSLYWSALAAKGKVKKTNAEIDRCRIEAHVIVDILQIYFEVAWYWGVIARKINQWLISDRPTIFLISSIRKLQLGHNQYIQYNQCPIIFASFQASVKHCLWQFQGKQNFVDF